MQDRACVCLHAKAPPIVTRRYYIYQRLVRSITSPQEASHNRESPKAKPSPPPPESKRARRLRQLCPLIASPPRTSNNTSSQEALFLLHSCLSTKAVPRKSAQRGSLCFNGRSDPCDHPRGLSANRPLLSVAEVSDKDALTRCRKVLVDDVF